jgi:inward rectifier potassium channel
LTHKPARPQQLLDARGRVLIERRGLRRSSLVKDAHHFLRTSSWTRIFTLFGAIYMVANFAFALVYWLGSAVISNGHGFLDCFWFSVQTMATIGYGYLAPVDNFADAVVTAESFVGIMLAALFTGMIFARFSTPIPRLLFSEVALITDFDGKRVLMFRVANERSTAIVEATVRVYLTRDETLASGEQMRRIYDIPVRRNTSPVFALTFLVVHDIDDKSPLYGMTPEQVKSVATNIVCTFTGIDDQLAAAVHARYLWGENDVVFDRRFVDLFRVDENGKRYLDLAPFHDTEPVTSPAGPASAG